VCLGALKDGLWTGVNKMPFAFAAAIGAVGSVAASTIQSGAQNNATNAQNARYGQIQSNSQPYMTQGANASSQLGDLMGTSGNTGAANYGYLQQQFNPTQDQLANYPGYQFQLQQGAQAVTNAATPQAGALSGSTLKNLMGFNQGLAASNYQNYFNQFQTQQNNIFNRLNNVAGLGQSAAAGVGNSGTQLGIGAAQSTAAAGASTASGIVGASNSIGQGAVLAGLMGNNNNQAPNYGNTTFNSGMVESGSANDPGMPIVSGYTPAGG